MKSGVVLLLAAFAVVSSPIARAAQFEVAYKSCADDDGEKLAKLRDLPGTCNASPEKLKRGRLAVRLTGDIAAGDAARLEKLLDDQVEMVASFGYSKGGGSYVTVYMAGEQGNLEGAIELGRFFKDNNVQTRIVRDARCVGPCALAFMGGRAQWGRLTRPAVDRRLEAGGQLMFGSPLFLDGDSANQTERLREGVRNVQSYAAHVDIPPLVLAKILQLKNDEWFAIDSVFWAKVAGITVDGILPMANAGDDDYISACLSQINWVYGLRGEYGEPPNIRDSDASYDEAKVLYRNKQYVIVAVVWSFSRYDYWCAINLSRNAGVKITRTKVRDILRKWVGRNTLLVHDYNDNIDLKGNQIYFSKVQNDLADTRAQNSLDLLLRSPTTKLSTIADPQFKWNAWTDWDPWFEHDGP